MTDAVRKARDSNLPGFPPSDQPHQRRRFLSAASRSPATEAAEDKFATKVLTPRTVAVRILGASGVYGLANLGIRALNFLLLPIYTRFLSPADYGIIALAETMAAFFAAIVSMGFDASIQRLYFRYVGEGGALGGYIGSVLKFAFAVQTVFVALVLTVGPWLQRTTGPASSVPYRYFALAMITATAAQYFNYRLVLCQAEHRPWAYAILAFVSFASAASLCVWLVVFARRGVVGMLGGKLIAAMICLAVALILARPVFRTSFHWAFVRETVSVGLPLVPHLLMALGLVTADRFILAHYRGLHEVGLYAVAYTFGMIMSLVTMSLNQAWAPIYYETANGGEEGRQVLSKVCSRLIIILTAIACFGALVAQPFIARFLDRRYAAAGRVVPWIIGAYLAHSLFSMFGIACMQARRTMFIMTASFVALAVNTAFNFALIPHWGMYGAAWATLLAYAVEAVVMYVLAQQSYHLRYDLGRLLGAILAFTVMLVATQLRWDAQLHTPMMAVATVLCFGLLAALGLNNNPFHLRGLQSRLP
jgi:O-antigen/teichoic acid export membrane protein